MGKPYKRKDHLYNRAKDEGFRSRAAYKLLELDKRYRLLRSGSKVLDLGCYPGGWLQAAAAKISSKGTLVGIDLVDVEPVAGAEILKGDFTDSAMREYLLQSAPYDLVLSDMSPKLSGIKLRDSVRSAELVELALSFCEQGLRPGGSFVAKIFPGEECEELAARCKKLFKSFARPCLDSSRNSSNELYFVGKGYRSESNS